ncbi:hypothetical protein [Mobilicoccus caccae]|uniref:DUF4298 domain-containing protein n=1 Tax=Mobilicoccus caccae TaxID=1859295 RepID=A0ABQ6IR19_9MICO|nr:hypothetical protein [Mobilicoccus caccae]GMA40347.1 hypothetical protein GCM10025883_23920 [Mobilicoccus caccae]
MTSNEDARVAIDQAQTLLERCQGDLARLDEILPWLEEAIARMRGLVDYYEGAGQEHLAAMYDADPQAVLPPVMDQDSVWEAGAGLDDRMQRLLRIVTAELTSGLDSRRY